MMTKAEKLINKFGKVITSSALSVGIASSNSACRCVYYQNKVPEAMVKFKKK